MEKLKTTVTVTIVNTVISFLLALLKIIVGYVGYSQAIVADGVHSLFDVLTHLLVLMAAKIGDQDPDQEHPYGHHRIETLGVIVISAILMIVGVGIAYDTIQPMVTGEIAPKPSYLVLVIAGLSIVANEILYHYTLAAGNKINSDLLRTNAWHNRSDALISVIVFLSVLGDLLGAHYLDAIGALFIAVLILRMGGKMLFNGIKELIDTGVDPATLRVITERILNTAGVLAIHQLRTRSHGGNVFVDVHIQVNSSISVSEGHYISEQVRIHLMENFNTIQDVTVHIDPENDETAQPSEGLPSRQFILASLNEAWKDFPYYAHIEKINLHYLNGKIQADVYIPQRYLQPNEDLTTLAKRYEQSAMMIKDVAHVKFYLSVL